MRVANEIINVFAGDPLQASSTKIYSSVFPLTKEIWYRMRLMLTISLTVGTGTGAISLGEYRFLKNIVLRTSDGEIIVSTPAVALYWFNYLMYGEESAKDSIAAANGTYKVPIDLIFAMPFLARPEDTCLDSGRYSNIELEITTGSVSDLLSSPGTASATYTLGCQIERSKAGFSGAGKPFGGYPVLKTLPPVPHTLGYIPFESSQDLVYFGLFVHSATSPVAGVPYSGTSADDINQISFGDSLIKFAQNVSTDYFREQRKKMAGANLTGLYPIHFIWDGSIMSAYRSGNVGEIRFEWGSFNTGGQETAFVYGFRRFKRE